MKGWIYDKFFPPQASQATIPIEAYWRIFERLAYISPSIRWINVEFFLVALIYYIMRAITYIIKTYYDWVLDKLFEFSLVIE